jgi:hypothetical protein
MPTKVWTMRSGTHLHLPADERVRGDWVFASHASADFVQDLQLGIFVSRSR